MDALIEVPDWRAILLPGTPFIETFIRGTATYLILFVLIRSAFKRQSGAVGITDLLVVVLIADAVQNAMADDYRSIADGVLLVSVILAWSIAIEWAGYHSAFIERFVHPPPLPLVEDGRMLWRNMRHELITEAELMTKLREQGVDDVRQVKRALMEGDGQISVVRREGEQHTALDRSSL